MYIYIYICCRGTSKGAHACMPSTACMGGRDQPRLFYSLSTTIDECTIRVYSLVRNKNNINKVTVILEYICGYYIIAKQSSLQLHNGDCFDRRLPNGGSYNLKTL